MSAEEFKLASKSKLRAAGYTCENKPSIRLDQSKVPAALHALIGLAEKFGISDDFIRDEVVKQCSQQELDAMCSLVAKYDDHFDEWLAGPEACGPNFSAEYIAFSSLRMTADTCE